MTAVDVSAARIAPGVVTVLTGAEIARLIKPVFLYAMAANSKMPQFHTLATDRVRFVGDPAGRDRRRPHEAARQRTPQSWST